MLRCKDVARQADDYLDQRLSWRQRLGVGLHLLICVHCRRYLAQLRLLIAGLRARRAPASDEEVRRVIQRLEEPDRD